MIYFVKSIWHQYFEGNSWWYLNLQGDTQGHGDNSDISEFFGMKIPNAILPFPCSFHHNSLGALIWRSVAPLLWESYFCIWKKLHYICNEKIKVGRASCWQFLKYRPLSLRPRGFRPCETMCFISGKNWRSWAKNQVTQTDSALNTNQILFKNNGKLMLPDRVIATQSSKKCWQKET